MHHFQRVVQDKRQKAILEQLPDYDSRKEFDRDKVNLTDLAALTAKTGDEFAMFTRGSKRLVIRGNKLSVNINIDKAKKLAENGYRWSGHTHPGNDELCLLASDGDYEILKAFKQKTSVTYNSTGQFLTYSL